MKTIASRAALLLSAVVIAILWTPASTTLSARDRPGVHLTRNGFRTPLYGVSQSLDANGTAAAACAALTASQVDAARVGRTVSRAMLASSPQAVVSTEGGATFDIRYTDADGTGFNHPADGATRRGAFEAAVSAWAKVIHAEQPIRVEASMHEMEDGDDNPLTTLLATAGPTEFWVIENRVVPSALAWQMLGGRYENAGDADITVNVNDRASWDFALNGEAERDKFSFVYTLMHELGHGLGFVDSFDSTTGKLLNDPLPFVYDVFVNRGSSRRNLVMDHAADEQKGDLKSRDLFFNGDNAGETGRASIRPLPMVKLYAPDPYQPGSSVSHVDQETYADTRTDTALPIGLMTPIIGSGSDTIDPLTLAIMKDIGYQLVPPPALGS